VRNYAGFTPLAADREVANTLADLIFGGMLTTDEVIDQGDDPAAWTKLRLQIRLQTTYKRPVLCSRKSLGTCGLR
jgi:hypothetical protein